MFADKYIVPVSRTLGGVCMALCFALFYMMLTL
jgi:hypothetical protein